MTVFEELTFDGVGDDGAPEALGVVDGMSSEQLRAELRAGLEAVGLGIGKAADVVAVRLGKAMQVPKGQSADVHDLREAVRHLRGWVADPKKCTSAPPKRPAGEQPEGPGRMPRPKRTKAAAGETRCGLCADPVPADGFIGRLRSPEAPYEAMSWLCRHCCYTRRSRPRRRDILLRVFHDLYLGQGVGLNAPECAVLHAWLTEDPRATETVAWKNEPLEPTLQRLRMSVREGKEETWLSLPTTHTAIGVLRELPPEAASSGDTVLLRAVAQHLDEWKYPHTLEPVKYGTGYRHRRLLLETTPSPTVLSALGGPFDLHQAVVVTPDQSEGTEGSEVSEVSEGA